ncbi:ribonuclease H2 subunit B-like [Acanthaster planci]|uniref:Ribonuclease H2 subunit B n=1 Tax=Acanthaster planci TaxID=133434 RepID=A0A8B7ZNL9_ACAPL|nr:ribonuclease H2 subunit B-like [Acanthaster planci]
MRLRDRGKVMPKREDSSQKMTKHTKKDQSQWVFLAPESVVSDSNSEEQDVAFVKLKHPKTDKAAMFLFSSDDSTVHELQSFKEKHRSWFINDTVQEDGSLMMATVIDPLFLILPYLEKADSRGKYMTLDQILDDVDYPQCHRLVRCSGVSDLHCISSVRGASDVQAYRFDRDKTLDWLKAKTERLAGKLEEKEVHVTSGAHAATFVRSSKGNNATKEDYLRYAASMISDYVTSDLSKQLFGHLGIKEVTDKKTAEPDTPSSEPPAKKARLSTANGEPEEDYSKNFNGNATTSEKSKPKLTAAQKALSKVDKSGMRDIASFFGKPKKSNSTK